MAARLTPLRVWIRPALREYLVKMVATGLYGTTPSGVVDRLVCKGIERYQAQERAMDRRR